MEAAEKSSSTSGPTTKALSLMVISSKPLFTALKKLPFPDPFTQQILLIMHSIDKEYCRAVF